MRPLEVVARVGVLAKAGLGAMASDQRDAIAGTEAGQRSQGSQITTRHDRRGDAVQCCRSPQGRKATGHGPGLHRVDHEGREGAVEVNRNQHPRPCREGGERNTKCIVGFSHSLIRSDALSDALRLAWLARSTPRRSSSLARVGRCGFAGAAASASR